MSNLVLQAQALRKTYRSGDRIIEVLRNVSLDLSFGESVSIRGESGSGKSTLLNLIAGLDKPDVGELFWEGKKIDADDVNALSGQRARFLGMVFQSFYLIPELNALENILMAARMLGSVKRADQDRASTLLGHVGLTQRADHLPSQLSGGERQRVAVARALMNSPKLVLADEPTGNLDEKTGDSVIELLLSLCAENQTTLVLVTHNAAHAGKTTRQLLLHEGSF